MLNWLTEEFPSRPLGLARSMIGAAAAIRGFIAIPVMIRLVDPDTLLAPHLDWIPEPNVGLVTPLIVVWIVSACAFTVGWHTSVAGVALALSIGLSIALDQQLYSNHLYLMLWLVALLTLAGAGAGLTIRRVDRPVVRWPVFLLMAQLSIVYGFSGLTKLNGDFLSGSILASFLRNGLVEFPEALRTPAFLTVLAAASVVVELFVAIFIWRPRFRPAAFILGLGLHTSITLLMPATGELFVFGLEMVALYPLFLSIGRLDLRTTPDCVACDSFASKVGRFDLLKTVDLSQAPNLSHVHLDHQYEGYTAVCRSKEQLVPHLWVAPLLRLPGVRQIGGRRFRHRHLATSQQR